MPLAIYTEVMPRDGVSTPPARRLALPFDRRQKTRQRARLEDGTEVGLQLPRGTTLRGGDVVRGGASCEDLLIEAAPEEVSTVRIDGTSRLARVAYHLGNRHVQLEVGDGWLRYLADAVLDGMVHQMGCHVTHELAPFEPESGAYHSHHHTHHDPIE